jgi:hypothetical protein
MDPATKGSKLLQGVNYASAGSGILNSTGMFFVSTCPCKITHPDCQKKYVGDNTYLLVLLYQGEIMTMWEQLEYFRDETQPEVTKLLGKNGGSDFFRKSLYYIISGSNDLVNGYYFIIPTSPPGISITDFIQLLVSTTSQQLKVKITIPVICKIVYFPKQVSKHDEVSHL